MWINFCLDVFQGDSVEIWTNLIECSPKLIVLRLSICNVLDVSNKAISIEIRYMDPQNFLCQRLTLSCTCRGYEIPKRLLPSSMRHPPVILALKFAIYVITIRTPKPKQLPQPILVWHIEGRVSDCRKGHQEDKDQDDQSSCQGLTKRSSKSTWLKFSVQGGLLGILRLFGLLSDPHFFHLGARLDHILVQLDDSNQTNQAKSLD